MFLIFSLLFGTILLLMIIISIKKLFNSFDKIFEEEMEYTYTPKGLLEETEEYDQRIVAGLGTQIAITTMIIN